MKAKSIVWTGYSQIHHGQSKVKKFTCVQAKKQCNMLQTKIFMSCDICILCRATNLLTYLMIRYVARHHLDAYCIPFWLTTSWCIVVTSKSWSITFWTWLWRRNYDLSFFGHCWETLFYHTYTVKVYYNFIINPLSVLFTSWNEMWTMWSLL